MNSSSDANNHIKFRSIRLILLAGLFWAWFGDASAVLAQTEIESAVFSGSPWMLAAILLLVLLVLRELFLSRRLEQARRETREQMQESLRKSEDKYRELFNGTNDAILIHDFETMNIVDVNERAVTMLEYSREELHNLPVHVISQGSPPFDGAGAQEWSRRVEAKGPQVFEWLARKKSGEVFWVEISLRPVELEGQQRILALVRDVDERVRSRDALNQSEALYRTLFFNAGNAYMFVETDNIMSLVNLEMEKLLGLNREDIEGKLKWTDFVAEGEDLQRMQEYHALRRNEPGRAPNIYETRLRSRQGRVFEALVNAVIIPGTAMTLASITDLSELRNAERARQKSEVMYQAIFENTGNASIIIAEDSVIQLANSEWLKLSGYTREVVDGRLSWTEFVHPDDLERMQAYHIARRQERFAPGKYEFRFVDRAGQVHHISNTVTLIPGTTLSIASMMDVTDLKNAEADRIHLQNLLAGIINSMPSMLVGIDRGKRINQWNLQAEKSTRLGRQQVMGRNIFRVLPFLSSCAELVEQTLCGGGINKVEKMLIFHEGRSIYTDVTIYPLEDAENGGGVIRIDDITEKVRVENIMIQTEKMMSVGGLAAGMAHEINNPLGGIIQGAQNISRRLDTRLEHNLEAARESGLDMEVLGRYLEKRNILKILEGIRLNGVRAARIVNNMLQFSRTGVSEHQPCDLLRLMERALELASNDYDLKKKYDFRHITIERQYHPGLKVIRCSETEIEQVLLNLLKNAAYSMAGGPTPTAHPAIVLRAYPEGDMAVVEVEDNGPGMDGGVAKRIFEPFFTTRPPGEGTGLGLSVSYFIVTENHGGQIYVDTQPGHGARFVIKLPVKGKAPAENGEAYLVDGTR